MIFFVPEETMVRYTLANEYPSEANNGSSFSPLKVKRTGKNNSMTLERSSEHLCRPAPGARSSIWVHLLENLGNLTLSRLTIFNFIIIIIASLYRAFNLHQGIITLYTYSHLTFAKILNGRLYYCPHFLKCKNETQKAQITIPRLPS